MQILILGLHASIKPESRKKMETWKPILVLLLSFLLSVSCQPTWSNSSHEPLLQCLLSYSQSSQPISSVIYSPNNASYSSVLQNYIRNLLFNESSTPKPLLILTALDESHVQAAIVCAREHKVQMKIRSGGHDYEGLSYVSNTPFFILDMFNLRSIEVDVESETAWVQAGATLGEVYYRVAEKNNTFGFPAGVCPTVGVGGHFSGGGYGNMMRKYGLSVDNIVDAKLIDVNGRLLDRKSMGEDLFWAITGGGGASFGVVIAYKINIVRVPEVVTVFRVRKTQEENAKEIVDQWQHVAYNLDDDLFIRLTMDVVNSTQTPGNKIVRATFLALFLGDSKTLLSIMNTSFPKLGLAQSDCIEMSWLESVLYWTNFALGTPTDALLSRVPQVMSHLKRKSDYVKKPIPIEGLEGLWKKMIELQYVTMALNPYGGKMAEVAPTATPFPHRAGNLWKIQYAVNWNVSGKEAAHHYIDLTRQLYAYMTPFVSKNPREAFLNYRDLEIGINNHLDVKSSYVQGRIYGVKYFKGNFNRLVQIKTKVDPQNFFWNEQSIPVLPYRRN